MNKAHEVIRIETERDNLYYIVTNEEGKEVAVHDPLAEVILEVKESTNQNAICEYCELDKDIYRHYINKHNPSAYVYIDDSSLNIEIFEPYGYSFVEHIKINYCPMCGRKL